jgi:TonB family protein
MKTPSLYRLLLVMGLALALVACSGGSPDAQAPSAKRADNPTPVSKTETGKALFSPTSIPDLLPFDESRMKSEGDLDPAVIRRIVNKRKSSFKVCYRKALADNPQAKGEIVVRFTVSPTGRVSTVEVRDVSLHSQTTEACVQRVMRRLRFPEWNGHARASVEYPMIFWP